MGDAAMMHHSMSCMDWDTGGMAEAPSAPETLQQTGLTLGFLNDLILRTLYTRGGMLGLDLAKILCLPFKVIEESLEFLKRDKCTEVLGGDLIRRISYRFIGNTFYRLPVGIKAAKQLKFGQKDQKIRGIIHHLNIRAQLFQAQTG